MRENFRNKLHWQTELKLYYYTHNWVVSSYIIITLYMIII